MPSSPRAFFESFQQVLENRLSREELAEVMDQSIWEFEFLNHMDAAGSHARKETLVRIGSICVSFYRLMSKTGMDPKLARAAIAEACDSMGALMEIGFRGFPAIPEKCPVADYFMAKNVPGLCESAFCGRCPEKDKGCATLKRMRILAAV
ncbi:MAG: hypothetical protein JWO30_1710 [Fibrobacteres bacterium]|nr:hypothetical protein [Fibrobacterota bacterium]